MTFALKDFILQQSEGCGLSHRHQTARVERTGQSRPSIAFVGLSASRMTRGEKRREFGRHVLLGKAECIQKNEVTLYADYNKIYGF